MEFYKDKVFVHDDILENNFADEGITAEFVHNDFEARASTCRVQDYLSLYARSKYQVQSSLKQANNFLSQPGQTLKPIFRRDPFTGKIKNNTDASYTPDDLHELSFGLDDGGELLFHISTNLLKSQWFKQEATDENEEKANITALKTEVKLTYDCD